ncbi:DUF2281 domain-containing protein [Methanoculleus sp. FWC-SCC1]|uniref:DUF2281 domain-containing protein n=1 Tax=Methanoculleus frigidifontis TaxID=2584085 RepID=A0ABT8M6J9_9EURY|nr:DUF2281 domain-containing protein [Methanoculleus sp. FWC-SCC1]
MTTELNGLPEQACEEVLDFIRFLKTRHRRDTRKAAIASESALGKDWLTPEEDAAWSHL